MFTDFGGEICNDEFDHFLLANGVGEHHANGPAEKGIDDNDRMTKAIMADKNILSRFWDIVAEHCVLLNTIASPAIDETTVFVSVFSLYLSLARSRALSLSFCVYVSVLKSLSVSLSLARSRALTLSLSRARSLPLTVGESYGSGAVCALSF